MSAFVEYQSYKDTGINWAGKIPHDWSCVPLKRLATFVNGNVFPPNSWVESGVPIIRIENLNGSDRFNYYDDCINEQHHVRFGDLLFGWSGNKGTSFGPYRWRRHGLHYLNQHIFRVSSAVVDNDWLYWCLRAVTVHVEEMASGIIGMVHVTKGELGAIKVCVPPFAEQHTVAKFLDFKTGQIDALIAKKKAMLERLAEKRTALISHAVTKGLHPSAPVKDSGVAWLGAIPSNWATKRLRFLTTMSGGMTPSTGNLAYWGGDIPWITPKDMKRDTLAGSIDTLTDEGVQETGLTLHKSGRVLIVVRGMILAHTFPVAINTVAATVNQDMKALSTSLNNEYLALLLKGIQPLILSIVEESAHGTKVLRTDVFKNICLPVPPHEAQVEIVSQVNSLLAALDAQRSAIESVILRLQEYRSTLITSAVTGKIDVRSFQVPQPVEGLAS
jgi:type I restriction enzyme S subunit